MPDSNVGHSCKDRHHWQHLNNITSILIFIMVQLSYIFPSHIDTHWTGRPGGHPRQVRSSDENKKELAVKG